MSKTVYIFLVLMFGILSSCQDKYKELGDGLFAEIETSKGTVIVKLDYKKTPQTVANFVTLAEGTNEFVTKEFRGKPYFDGLKFHRVISIMNGDDEDFMIQTGDPLGNGSGDAGYKFNDEITDLKHDEPGVLSMANSGPNSNSSQFFITLAPTKWLDGLHTAFGKVVGDGMTVVKKIIQDDYIKKIKIIRNGAAVKKFDAIKVFSDSFRNLIENQKNQLALEAEKKRQYFEKFQLVLNKKMDYFNGLKTKATKTPSGLEFLIIEKGSGIQPKQGENVRISYSGYLEDGTLFDTSNPEIAKEFGVFDEERGAQNGYSEIPFQIGSSGMISGFLEGLTKLKMGDKAVIFIPFNLGYGERGAGNVIPPNANLIFEIELKNN